MSIQVSSKALSLRFVLNRHDFFPPLQIHTKNKQIMLLKMLGVFLDYLVLDVKQRDLSAGELEPFLKSAHFHGIKHN